MQPQGPAPPLQTGVPPEAGSPAPILGRSDPRGRREMVLTSGSLDRPPKARGHRPRLNTDGWGQGQASGLGEKEQRQVTPTEQPQAQAPSSPGPRPLTFERTGLPPHLGQAPRLSPPACSQGPVLRIPASAHTQANDLQVGTAGLAAPRWERTRQPSLHETRYLRLPVAPTGIPTCITLRKGPRGPAPERGRPRVRERWAGASFPGRGPAHVAEGALPSGGARWGPARRAEV